MIKEEPHPKNVRLTLTFHLDVMRKITDIAITIAIDVDTGIEREISWAKFSVNIDVMSSDVNNCNSSYHFMRMC